LPVIFLAVLIFRNDPPPLPTLKTAALLYNKRKLFCIANVTKKALFTVAKRALTILNRNLNG
jgi:hypothetical protein